MKKIVPLILLMLLYPLFLRLVHIQDLRAIPLIVPYLLGRLSIIVIVSEIGSFVLRKLRPPKEQ
ncbi:hypothetical protein LJK88_31425 [Paenibacillus sp. P26]|nr:hypothetical protein LJK88_31425 [Paenibacillus sp. P26]UUZ94272.1 hypothetical protein LJK87_06650 [Paenibacillus sp. P25]